MYTPTPEFIAALESIDALTSNSETPEPVRALGTATRSGLLELAAKQQMLQTMIENQSSGGSQQLQASASQPQDQAQGGELLEASPPPLTSSIPPGMYEAPRNADGTQAGAAIGSGYEPLRSEDGTVSQG